MTELIFVKVFNIEFSETCIDVEVQNIMAASILLFQHQFHPDFKVEQNSPAHICLLSTQYSTMLLWHRLLFYAQRYIMLFCVFEKSKRNLISINSISGIHKYEWDMIGTWHWHKSWREGLPEKFVIMAPTSTYPQYLGTSSFSLPCMDGKYRYFWST